jgi:di/tripeptidase
MNKQQKLDLLKLMNDYVEQCYNISIQLFKEYYYDDPAEDFALLAMTFKASKRIIQELMNVIKKE